MRKRSRTCGSPNRDPELIALVEAYTKEQGLFRTDETPDPLYSDSLELDLATVTPSMAGPKRPQDRVELPGVRKNFYDAFPAGQEDGGGDAGAVERRRGDDRERRGGDRGDHELHEHVESVGDAGGGAAGEEGGGARTEGEAVGEDEPRARVQGRDGLLQRRRGCCRISRR